MPCNTHKYCGTGNIPRNIIHSYYSLRSRVQTSHSHNTKHHHLRVQPWPLRGLWSQTSCPPCLRALAARQRRKLCYYGREMGGFEPFDTFRCHRTSRSFQAYRWQRHKQDIHVQQYQTPFPGEVWSDLRVWPRTTACRLNP